MEIKIRYFGSEMIQKINAIAKQKGISRQKYLKRKLEEIIEAEFKKLQEQAQYNSKA